MNYNLDLETGIELLYRGESIDNHLFENSIIEPYNSASEELGLNKLPTNKTYSTDFQIPQDYLDIDIEEYIWNKFTSQSISSSNHHKYKSRVETEIELFKSRNLFPILQLLIYIVDNLHKNNCVYGVGRGSSVASYCLYLIGIHRIDSVKYNLDITEFLKE